MTDDPTILDHRCADCEFSLIGLDRDAPCPECGGHRRLHNACLAVGTRYQRNPGLLSAVATAWVIVERPIDAVLDMRTDPPGPKWINVSVAAAIAAITTIAPAIIIGADVLSTLWIIALPPAGLVVSTLINDLNLAFNRGLSRERRAAITAHAAFVAPAYMILAPILPMAGFLFHDIAALVLGYVAPWIGLFAVATTQGYIVRLCLEHDVAADSPVVHEVRTDGLEAE